MIAKYYPPTPTSSTIVARDSKIDAVLSGAVLLGFLLLLAGNLVARADLQWGRKIIVCGLMFGTAGAAALSARVFWRHRIGLAAWLLMFGVHAMGMALATQAFNWMHKGDAATGPGTREVGTNALLLTAALLVALLVRGAVLQAAAKNMPGWLTVRKENQSAIPRLWLFALYWISPLAWWAGILCAVNIFTSNDASGWASVGLLICVAIATVRVAVRIVLFEKNKYMNWQRSPQGWAKFRAALNSVGFVLAGAVTFYAYFFMASRVQDDAFEAMAKKNTAARQAEIKAMQPPSLPANQNAETIYRLARQSVAPVNWPWAERNWNTAAARTEVARNLTALSYLRQAAAVKGVDYWIDWSDQRQRTWPAANMSASRELAKFAQLEARQCAAKNDWQTVADDFRACLGFARHQSQLPLVSENALQIEKDSAQIFAAALFQPDANPPGKALLEMQAALQEHIDARGDFANRQTYFQKLCGAYGSPSAGRMPWEENPWPGNADIQSMVYYSAIRFWHVHLGFESELSMTKLAVFRRMDRQDADDLMKASTYWKPDLPYRNLDSLEALRLLEAAIGVKRYQLQHGAWPNTLAECVPQFLPEIPGDPDARGRFIQYEPSPPRVFSIGKALSYLPEQHGFPDEDYFSGYALRIKESESGNRILFLAN